MGAVEEKIIDASAETATSII